MLFFMRLLYIAKITTVLFTNNKILVRFVGTSVGTISLQLIQEYLSQFISIFFLKMTTAEKLSVTGTS